MVHFLHLFNEECDEQDEDEYEGQKGAEEDAEPGDGLGSIL